MTTTPEVEPQRSQETISQAPGGVVERQESMEITPELERANVQRRAQDPSDVQDHVADDSGKPITSSPATQTVTIQLPADQGQLTDWSKGSVTDSLTWFARFWLRIIKKAAKMGWEIVVKGGK